MSSPSSETSEETRKLSYHERFSLSRRLAGFAHPVVFVLSYSSPSSLPSSQFLSSRIQDLQNHFPLLHSLLRNERTRNPLYVQSRLWRSDEVLRQSVYDVEPKVAGVDETEKARKEKERVLFEEINRMVEEDITVRPMWQVSLLTPSIEGEGAEVGTAYLVLSADHIIIDGMGALNLLKLLLVPTLPPDLPFEKLSKIPTLEDTHDLRPRYITLLPLAFRELILPKLPTFLQKYLAAPPSWPGSNFKIPPTAGKFALSLCEIPSDIIGRLKVEGRQHKVKTLHPILKIAFMVAMWDVYASKSSPETPLTLVGGSPTSLRDVTLGHSYITACYSGSLSYTLSLKSTDDFWKITKTFSDYLKSEGGKKDALGGMGMLGYLPDGAGPFPSSGIEGAGDEGKTPTQWERFFWDKALSNSPFNASMNISNLGYIPLKPLAHLPTSSTEGGQDGRIENNSPTDMIWGQMGTPFGSPFSVSCLGTENGVRLTTSWRDGSALVRDDVEKVEKAFIKVLERLADGVEGSLGELTL